MLRKVYTKLGAIEGVPCGDPRVTAFLGVPYAKPPVGELRWKAPQPLEPWEGVYKADHFGPISMQGQPGLDWSDFYTYELNPTGYEYKMSEDCLYINIYSPAKTAAENLPVFFYIHGGGYRAGYSYETEFDGERVAKNGVIFVSVGYRLGALGFFAHPDLNEAGQGNFGLLDQLAAMKWVKEHIAAFGGNPNQIVIAGQSAGGGAVNAHCLSPMSNGSFQGAVLMSGGGLRAPIPGQGSWRTMEQAQADGKQLLDLLHVKTIEEARRLPAEMISATGLGRWPGRARAPWSPTIDGMFLLEDTRDAILAGHINNVPIMIGCCRKESSRDEYFGPQLASRETYTAHVKKNFSPIADELLSLVDLSSEEAFVELTRKEFTLGNFWSGVIAYATRLSRMGRPVYTYLFDHDIPGEDQPGSFHGSDLMFVFDSLGHSWRPYEGKHYDLARQVSSYWMNFVKTGDPNGKDRIGKDLPRWETYDETNRFTICFKDEPEQLQEGNREIIDLLVDYTLRK